MSNRIDLLEIKNEGARVVSTNFWETEYEREGILYLSTNARAFRLLLPSQWEPQLAEMATAKIVTVARAPGEVPARGYAVEIMFDDGSQSPYCIHLSAAQLDRIPPIEEAGCKDLEFTAWTQPRRQGGPHEALHRPAQFVVRPLLR